MSYYFSHGKNQENKNITVCSFYLLNRSLKKTISRDNTSDKNHAQRLLDVELASIASKEYNVHNLKLRDA